MALAASNYLAFYGGQSNLAYFYKFILHNHNFHHQNQLQVGSVLQCPPFLPSIYNYRMYQALRACFNVFQPLETVSYTHLTLPTNREV